MIWFIISSRTVNIIIRLITIVTINNKFVILVYYY